MSAEVLYFGCIARAGHYLWSPSKGKLWFGDLPDGFPESWTFRESHGTGRSYVSESAIAPRPRGEQGAATMVRADGWTCISFPDRTVDSRPNCVSAFLTHDELTSEQLLALAATAWPRVMARFDFGIHLRALSSEDATRPTPALPAICRCDGNPSGGSCRYPDCQSESPTTDELLDATRPTPEREQ